MMAARNTKAAHIAMTSSFSVIPIHRLPFSIMNKSLGSKVGFGKGALTTQRNNYDKPLTFIVFRMSFCLVPGIAPRRRRAGGPPLAR
jgi:hypothetical protein